MRIYIKVSPRSSKNEIYPVESSLLRGAKQFNRVDQNLYGEYKVKLTAAPVDGQANEALIKLLAKFFDVSKSAINIVGGKTAKIKMVDIAGLG
ncbi:MAG: DUF167 domain-containing protein [Candidatus Moraniibacteriota bacterium]